MKYIIYESHQCAYCGHVMRRQFLHVSREEGIPPKFTFSEPNIVETCDNGICPQYNKPMKVEILTAEPLEG